MSKNWILLSIVLCEVGLLSGATALDTAESNQNQTDFTNELGKLVSAMRERIEVGRNALAGLSQTISKIEKHHEYINKLKTFGAILVGPFTLIAVHFRASLTGNARIISIGMICTGAIIISSAVFTDRDRTKDLIVEVKNILETEKEATKQLESLQNDMHCHSFALIFDDLTGKVKQKDWKEDMLTIARTFQQAYEAIKSMKDVDTMKYTAKDVGGENQKNTLLQNLECLVGMSSLVSGWTTKHPTQAMIEEVYGKLQKRINVMESFTEKIALLRNLSKKLDPELGRALLQFEMKTVLKDIAWV